MDEQRRKTLSDDEARERDELIKLLENPEISVITSTPEPQKVSAKNVAWGVALWLAWALVVLIVGSYFVMLLWNNVALELGAPEITYTGAMNLAVLAYLLHRISDAVRLSK